MYIEACNRKMKPFTQYLDTTASDRPHEREGGIPHHMMTSSLTPHSPSVKGASRKPEDHTDAESPTSGTSRRISESASSTTTRRRLNLSDSGGEGGGGAVGVSAGLNREQSSGMVCGLQ